MRNLPDSRVEVVLEGTESVVDQALAFVRQGPSGAFVTGVEIKSLPSAGYADFEIRH